ncbi:MAG: MFS transporter [Oscillospiraceae bacterium]|nr:MFS transporter [Oscillospiraceae bacterium]
MKVKNPGKGGAGFLIFLVWLVYATSYLGKVNYSANITQIIDFYQVTKAEAGLPPTFFFFAYGVGQVVNGLLCKRYPIKLTIFVSLTLSSLLNLTIAVSSDFGIVKWLWLANGFALSLLWPTLIRLLSESLATSELGKSSVVVGTTVACGTLAAYALGALFAFLNRFKLSFYAAAFADLLVAGIWLFSYQKATNMALIQKAREDAPEEKETANAGSKASGTMTKPVILSIVFLCLFAIVTNLVKDGLTTWVPSVLKEEYALPDAIAILLTLILPIVAIFGNALALAVHKKIPDYITHSCVCFAAISGILGVILWSLGAKIMAAMLVGLILTNLLASSINSLISSIYPMFMRKQLNSGMFAGILNGFCYLGSTISSYGLGSVADKHGWFGVFWLLLGVCLFCCVIWLIYVILRSVVTGKAKSPVN